MLCISTIKCMLVHDLVWSKTKKKLENQAEEMDVGEYDEPEEERPLDIQEEEPAERPEEPAERPVEKDDEVKEGSEKRPPSPVIFNSSTLVAENASLEAFVVKSYLKRQIKFQ